MDGYEGGKDARRSAIGANVVEPGAKPVVETITPAAVAPRWAIVGIFLLLLVGALYFTASFVLPVVFALLFALVLSPVVRVARRRLRLPEPLTAGILVVGACLALLFGFYLLSGPAADIVNNAPRYVAAIDEQLQPIRTRLERLAEAQRTMVATGGPQDAPEPVVVESPGLVDSATTLLPELLAGVAFALIFLYFLLASGNLFYAKLVHAMPRLSDKKLALTIAGDIERELSRYFFTITMINVALGVVIGSALWFVGMPTPVVFGALATLVNFIPYLGPLAGMILVGIVALADFGSLGEALLPVLVYFACTSIEGQFLTPMIVGRRLEMNAAAVFLSVAFWGYVWGVVGMFLAVPVMVAIKVFASHVEALRPFGDFLSATDRPAGRDASPESPGA